MVILFNEIFGVYLPNPIALDHIVRYGYFYEDIIHFHANERYLSFNMPVLFILILKNQLHTYKSELGNNICYIFMI